MSSSDTLSSGDVFNARDLATKDVASRFIAPPAFSRLLSDAHCILEGPRGSGKTTLLRMLTPEAFALWRAQSPGESIGFIGIFVPADIRWAKQLRVRLSGINNPNAKEAVQHSAFSVAVCLSFIDTIEQCGRLNDQHGAAHPQLFIHLSRALESELVSSLSSLWGLPIGVPSFSGLRLALRRRQHDLSAIALRLSEGATLAEQQAIHSYLSSTWLDNIVTGIETANDILQRPQQRWAILLDELEIVPQDLLRSIADALRSTSSLLRFKLALSPTGSDLIPHSETGASTPADDYRPVKLWYSSLKEARNFTDQLFSAALTRLGALSDGKSLVDILGASAWEIPRSEENDDEDESPAHDTSKLPIETNSQAQRERIAAFLSLYQKDESFKNLLDSKKIDPKAPPISDSNANGTLVRKITPLVLHRDREIESFKLSDGHARRKGGRRGSQPYHGYPNLVDLTEGNPRWVLTLAEALVAQSATSTQKISTSTVQTQAISNFVQQFSSKLTVYPTKAAAEGRRWTPRQFMEALGNSIAATLYDSPFATDPPLSFKIDQRALNNFGEYIRTCIDLGALVIIRRGASAPLKAGGDGQALLGARVRISFRLAPYFRLPLRSTKEQSISAAIKSGELLREAVSADPAKANDVATSTDESSTHNQPIQQQLPI
ncbi:hypothetical protein [Metapseudomonas otitidis]|uniref:ORC-CDC6 family AAA ATPase n=1 Tax=Metapseudomonas otitidis TaxID=319939 RepID=UPI0013F5A302|nr:hypothetical protein [Pseudomonas otitidis]